jgi:hypothetical protein
MMLANYEIVNDKIHLTTGYSDDIVAACREWCGVFDRANGVWILPLTRLDAVQEKIGKNLKDAVEIEIGMDRVEGCGQIRHGWYVLASRKNRDWRANVYADLVAGEIPSSGGSMKNPAVAPSSDAKFRLWVARDFAVTNGSTIVTDPDGVSTQFVLLAAIERRILQHEKTAICIPDEIASRIDQIATMD